MKTCTKCGQKKKVGEFSFRNRAKGILQSRCKTCMKEYDAQNYRQNKTEFTCRNKAITDRMLTENRKKILEYLQSHSCVDCGETDPVVLEFDHRDDKKENISNMMSKCTWLTVSDEIQKCDVRCANCHRRKTAKEFGHYRFLVG